MDLDAEVTYVVFRRWRGKDKTLIALFPAHVDDPNQPFHYSSFEHVGQHSVANYLHVLRSTKTVPLDHPDVVELKDELTHGYGYRLEPRLRFNQRRPPPAIALNPPAPVPKPKQWTPTRITKREVPMRYGW